MSDVPNQRLKPRHRRGSLLMVVVPLGLVVFVAAMAWSQRGSALRRELSNQRDRVRARRLAASAAAEGLAAAHRELVAFVAARGTLDPPNHDAVLGQLQGRQWDVTARECPADNPEPSVLSVRSVTVRVADDTPVHRAHVGDIEVTALVAIDRPGRPARVLRLQERRAFRLGDTSMQVVLCRRPLRVHLTVDGEVDGS